MNWDLIEFAATILAERLLRKYLYSDNYFSPRRQLGIPSDN